MDLNALQCGIQETLKHRNCVRHYLSAVCLSLLQRRFAHDESKLHSPEAEVFAEYTPKLKGSTYGSNEYKRFLAEMKPALDHHYAENPHHPEHFENGIRGMTLVDLLEMLCDWKAATLRHADGDIMQSIAINQKRFGYSDELREILTNTVQLLEEVPPCP